MVGAARQTLLTTSADPVLPCFKATATADMSAARESTRLHGLLLGEGRRGTRDGAEQQPLQRRSDVGAGRPNGARGRQPNPFSRQPDAGAGHHRQQQALARTVKDSPFGPQRLGGVSDLFSDDEDAGRGAAGDRRNVDSGSFRADKHRELDGTANAPAELGTRVERGEAQPFAREMTGASDSHATAGEDLDLSKLNQQELELKLKHLKSVKNAESANVDAKERVARRVRAVEAELQKRKERQRKIVRQSKVGLQRNDAALRQRAAGPDSVDGDAVSLDILSDETAPMEDAGAHGVEGAAQHAADHEDERSGTSKWLGLATSNQWEHNQSSARLGSVHDDTRDFSSLFSGRSADASRQPLPRTPGLQLPDRRPIANQSADRVYGSRGLQAVNYTMSKGAVGGPKSVSLNPPPARMPSRRAQDNKPKSLPAKRGAGTLSGVSQPERRSARLRPSAPALPPEPQVVEILDDTTDEEDAANADGHLPVVRGTPEGGRPVTRTRACKAQPALWRRLNGLKAVFPPEGGTDCVPITPDDLSRLAPEEFLNDSIIDMYMKWLWKRLDPKVQAQCHFFSSYFYKKLTEPNQDAEGLDKNKARHARMKRWTKTTDIFAKKFLFIPIHDALHWSLVIVCHPGHISGLQPPAFILHLDSMKGGHNTNTIVNALRPYLQLEWKTRADENPDSVPGKWQQEHPGAPPPNLRIMRQLKGKVPQQTNHTDCGLFLLTYLQYFIHSIPNITCVDVDDLSKVGVDTYPHFLTPHWFQPSNASLLREELQYIVLKLFKEQMKLHKEDVRLQLLEDNISSHESSSNKFKSPEFDLTERAQNQANVRAQRPQEQAGAEPPVDLSQEEEADGLVGPASPDHRDGGGQETPGGSMRQPSFSPGVAAVEAGAFPGRPGSALEELQHNYTLGEDEEDDDDVHEFRIEKAELSALKPDDPIGDDEEIHRISREGGSGERSGSDALPSPPAGSDSPRHGRPDTSHKAPSLLGTAEEAAGDSIAGFTPSPPPRRTKRLSKMLINSQATEAPSLSPARPLSDQGADPAGTATGAAQRVSNGSSDSGGDFENVGLKRRRAQFPIPLINNRDSDLTPPSSVPTTQPEPGPVDDPLEEVIDLEDEAPSAPVGPAGHHQRVAATDRRREAGAGSLDLTGDSPRVTAGDDYEFIASTPTPSPAKHTILPRHYRTAGQSTRELDLEVVPDSPEVQQSPGYDTWSPGTRAAGASRPTVGVTRETVLSPGGEPAHPRRASEDDAILID